MSPAFIQPDGAALDSSSPNAVLVCPHCGRPHRRWEIICGNCGTVFNIVGQTKRMEEADIPVEPQKKQPIGDAYVEETKNLTFVVGSTALPAAISNTLVLGRRSGIAGDPEPDVDLAPYEADDKGVSRRHVRIECKHHLLYVYDLGSSNGTWLNGRLLVANSGYLLRDGDELCLGRMKMRIRF